MDLSKILVVEDDIYLREEIAASLMNAGYEVDIISSFTDIEQQILSIDPDLVILDINLPGQSGFAICKNLKNKSSIPILILTSRDALSDELKALGLGADDYLVKPCPARRLNARVKRLLQVYDNVKNTIQGGGLTLDLDSFKLSFNNKHVTLPETEGKILQLLIQKHPKTVAYQDIVQSVWGSDIYVDDNILQVNMTRLRKNLNRVGLEQIVKTIRGQGYALEYIEYEKQV